MIFNDRHISSGGATADATEALIDAGVGLIFHYYNITGLPKDSMNVIIEAADL